MALKRTTGLSDYNYSIQCNLTTRSTATSQSGVVTVYPRYNTSTADTFTFSSSGDYAPTAAAGGDAFIDFTFDLHNISLGQSWFNQLYTSTDFGRRPSGDAGGQHNFTDWVRLSLWGDIGIGDSPHPGYGVASTRIAILQNAHGAYFSLQTTGSPPVNYSDPRTLFDNRTTNSPDRYFTSLRIGGQAYGTQGLNYNQWHCLAEGVNYSSANATYIRLINLGGKADTYSKIHIKSLVLVATCRAGYSGDA